MFLKLALHHNCNSINWFNPSVQIIVKSWFLVTSKLLNLSHLIFSRNLHMLVEGGTKFFLLSIQIFVYALLFRKTNNSINVNSSNFHVSVVYIQQHLISLFLNINPIPKMYICINDYFYSFLFLFFFWIGMQILILFTLIYFQNSKSAIGYCRRDRPINFGSPFNILE